MSPAQRCALGRLALVAFGGLAAHGLAACSLPAEAYDSAPADAPTASLAATDSTVRTVQLHLTGEEASLPVLSLRGSQTRSTKGPSSSAV